jgi:ribonuclease P protein component
VSAATQASGTRAASAGFSVSARVRSRAEYDRVFTQGRRVADRLLVLHVLAAPTGGARLGLAVSRKVDPRAVGRNRIKRALREQFRRLRATLAAGDYVVVARGAAREAAPAQLRNALFGLLQRCGALPPPTLTGTMPAPPPDDA